MLDRAEKTAFTGFPPMADIRTVTENFAVAPQILPDDIASLAAGGFKLVISNRPDAEVPPALGSQIMAEAAKAAGLAYVHIPIVGIAGPAQVEAVSAAIAEADGPVLAYCRSGTRSITAWALGQAKAGDRTPEEIVELGREAGYDLSGLVG